MDFAVEGAKLGVIAMVAIDELGQVLCTKDGTGFFLNARSDLWGKNDWKALENLAAECMTVALATVNFMNCKNVQIIDNEPTRQQKRHAAREGKKPPVSYKTLQIIPFGRAAREREKKDPTGAHLRLHICRGHFKDFRLGKGLGRAHRHGIWWWNSQRRGREEVGQVIKDYDVIPEKEER
jgi:hypothetical protein